MYGVDPDLGTYERYERERGIASELFRNLRGDNKFDIAISDKKRKGDRNYTARYYMVPFRMVTEIPCYMEAREYQSTHTNALLYCQENGQGFLAIENKFGLVALVVRLYVIKHEVNDGTEHFYYDKDLNKCSLLSFDFNLFYSDSKQARNKQQFIMDKCTHIETVYMNAACDDKSL